MSRVGKKPIDLPSEVKVNVTGGRVQVEGPKGKLDLQLTDNVKVNVKDGILEVEAIQPEKNGTSTQGLTRALIANMVHGVTQQFSKGLSIVGVGYRAEVKGQDLMLTLGFSHPITLNIPKGLSVSVEKQTAIEITGIDKYQVGQFAAQIRKLRPPEPYKGKGILYKGEVIKRKEGKTAGA